MSATDKFEYSYYINYPISTALRIRDELENKIFEIAKQQEITSILVENNFKVQASETAIDANFPIQVVVHWLQNRAMLEITDPVVNQIQQKTMQDIWLQIILPKLREKWGDICLVDKY